MRKSLLALGALLTMSAALEAYDRPGRGPRRGPGRGGHGRGGHGYEECTVRRGRIVLHFDGQRFGRFNDTMYIRRSIMDMCGIRTRNMHIDGVVLVAKSRRGFGSASFRVGDDYTPYYRVGGMRGRMDRIRFYNPKRGSRGPWQMHFRGNIRVRKLVVLVDDYDRGGWGDDRDDRRRRRRRGGRIGDVLGDIGGVLDDVVDVVRD